MVTKDKTETHNKYNTNSYMRENYNNPEELISDESFVSWCNRTDAKCIADWQQWIAAHPDKQEMVNHAAAILNLIRFQNTPISIGQIEEAEARLRQAINDPQPAKIISIKRKRIWYAAAAVAALLIVLSVAVIYKPSSKSQLTTQYGQIKKDKLPDGTEVFLNANSTVTYEKGWQEGKTREVWIQGEAFFHVKKTPSHDKFIVHTDAFDIEVTGTSFNVINKDGKSSIILKEGSVKIHRPGEAEILMKPGDMVEFSNEKIEKKIVTKQDYMAWMDNKLDFDNTPVTEIVKLIKEHYGVDVKINGNNLANQTITAVMPNDNLDVLLQALDATQELKVIRNGDSITISSDNQ
ncbi:MAG TPA: FecR domain-containing protein [Chitinophagaceae bacterium]|nr:FecR domain-containing protein [Chitinophagaceae bacterium]